MPRSSSRQSDFESPSNNSQRRSRFRLPVSPNRTSGLPPAEYENIDFETRLASFSDDDLPLDSRSKHARRQSKDDAWVDILVANNNRRMAGQDAELRTGLKGGRSDPELASQEISEVLASLGQVQSDDEDEEMEPVPHDEDEHAIESSVDENSDRDTIPGPRIEVEAEDADEDTELVPARPKRMGYFDLHPERRNSGDPLRSVSPTLRPEAGFDDARAHFERNSVAEDPRDAFKRSSLDSQPESAEEPLDVTAQPRPSPKLPLKAGLPSGPASTRGDVNQLQPPPRGASKLADPNALKPTQSKTASLIEMYRERERSTTSSPTTIPPSRLPVRTGASLPSSVQLQRSSPSPSPPRVPEEPEEEETFPEPARPSENSGYITPPRYIHGAPLHNVMEEEEEEEE